MSKFKYEVEVPKCFVDIVEYIYRIPYDEVIDRIHAGTIPDEIWIIAEHRETSKVMCSVDKYFISSIRIDKTSYLGFVTFRFIIADELQLYIRFTDTKSLAFSGVISWILEHGYDMIECLSIYNMKYMKYPFRLTPYLAIPHIVQYHNIDALDALCTYADGEKNFIFLLDEFDKIGAIEEKMIAVRFAHDRALNITQDVKLEL